MKTPNVKKPCGGNPVCPFRKDSPEGWLGSERMEEILDAGSFTCHKDNSLQCAGHMLVKGMDNDYVRHAARLGIDTGASGQELAFDNAQDCIEHHDESTKEHG